MKAINDIYIAQNRPIKIAQFGEGGFLRAFVDWMIDIANERGAFCGNVAIIKPRAHGDISAFARQDNLYTVELRGIVDGAAQTQDRVVRSIGETINPFENIEAFWALAEISELEFVVSNTTEAIEFRADDARPENGLSLTFPGKLTQFLYRRYEKFAGANDKGLIMLPAELNDRNGELLKNCVLKYCAAWRLGADFIKWIETACVFACTLVDRIVTGYPKAEIAAIESRLGYKDELIVTAEPFALWVIESAGDISARLPLDKAGLPVIFTRDIAPYKERKVRILNGAHTSSVLAAYLAGCNTVLDMMNDPQMSEFIRRAVFDEMAPCVPLPLNEAQAFAESVLERFKNPYVRHQLLSIALNSFAKWRARLLNTLRDDIARGEFPRRIAFSMAALLAFYTGENTPEGYMGTTARGKYRIMDDERVIAEVGRACKLPADKYAHAILSNAALWGEDISVYQGFEACVARDLENIRRSGIRAAMKEI